MPVLSTTVDDGMVEFSMEQCAAKGAEFHEQYTQAAPFPHIALDDFVDVDVLRRVVDEFPGRQQGLFNNAQSRKKTGYQLEMIKSRYITHLMYALNSAAMLRFVEELTGIQGLTADPFFVGAGLHETSRGGHLSIHADFNQHPKLKLIRRVNLLVFLNEEWDDDWEGHLELWDEAMENRCHKIAPLMGRAVLFNTTGPAYHGHPVPLATPEDRFRRSIALYYYTAPEGSEEVDSHTTLFQVRPGSDDEAEKRTLGSRVKNVAAEVCPPFIWKHLRGS